ncbi:MAG TPA: stage 0 sporulation family protein [Syntrophales bacterium]|nr:stage 0 sporulation family protein [Syntrophales bacterium]
MAKVVGVKFKREGKVYYFDPGELALKKGDAVICETDQGLVFGQVVSEIREAADEAVTETLKPIVRKATEDDLQILKENQVLEQKAYEFCRERIKSRALPMKLVATEYLFDRTKIIFYFTAENRVDFRELVKDLVQQYRTRIELRQIGARQETRILKGLGICGREVCCATLLQNLDRVSVKMAKEQNMALNPEKISGLCGRLMCCLAYEYETYQELKKRMPKCGKVITTPAGQGKVIRQDVLKEEIALEMEDGNIKTIKIEELV